MRTNFFFTTFSGNYPEIIFDDDNHFTDHGSYDFEGFCDLLRKSAQVFRLSLQKISKISFSTNFFFNLYLLLS